MARYAFGFTSLTRASTILWCSEAKRTNYFARTCAVPLRRQRTSFRPRLIRLSFAALRFRESCPGPLPAFAFLCASASLREIQFSIFLRVHAITRIASKKAPARGRGSEVLDCVFAILYGLFLIVCACQRRPRTRRVRLPGCSLRVILPVRPSSADTALRSGRRRPRRRRKSRPGGSVPETPIRRRR